MTMVSAFPSSSADGHSPFNLNDVATRSDAPCSRHLESNWTPALCSCSPGPWDGRPAMNSTCFLSAAKPAAVRATSTKGKSFIYGEIGAVRLLVRFQQEILELNDHRGSGVDL